MESSEYRIARYLLQSKAIKLEPAIPFTWASGWKSPIYCDNRITLSYPEIRTYIRDCFADKIQKAFPGTEVIAGVATGAIAQGALVAQKLDLPFVYVRSSPKDHGRENLIEGEIMAGKKVVIVEDLISTGNSSLKAYTALQEAGFIPLGMVAIFTYGFPDADENFRRHGCRLETLCHYDILIQEASASGYIKPGQLDVLKGWRANPSRWTP